jgi:DNA-binding transcriptional regulator of glucitol operon
VRHLLTSPRWIAVHLALLILVGVQLRLGLWQWHRAEGTGGVQNLGYAIQWPIFAGFTIYLWWRSCRDELRPAAQKTPVYDDALPGTAPRVTAADVDDSNDPELAAYNAYLASLAEQAAENGRR